MIFQVKNISILLLLFIFWGGLFAKSPVINEQVEVYALDNAWTIYDNQLKNYVPFLPQLHTTERQLYLILDCERYKDFDFSILGYSGNFLLFNNNLSYKFNQEAWQHFSIDSLSKLSKNKLLLITYLSAKTFERQPNVSISLDKKQLSSATTNTDTKDQNDDMLILPKAIANKISKNFLMIATLGILVILAFFSQTIKPIFSLNMLWISLDSFLKGKNQIKRFSAPSILFFLFFYGFSIAYVIIFLSTYTPLISYSFFLDTGVSIFEKLQNWGLLSSFIIAFVCIKFLIIWLLGSLYNDRQIVNLHFQEYMGISQIFCAILLFITLLANSIATILPQIYLDSIVYIFLFFLILQALLMTYRINNGVNYRKIYLFSYLCASEYLPLILSAKLFSQ